MRHFIYYIDRYIELDGDSHGPKGRELLEQLIASSPHKGERVLQAACGAIKARIGLWDGTLSKLRGNAGAEQQHPGIAGASAASGNRYELLRGW